MDGHPSESASLREVMGSYPTGVTIVASRDPDGTPFGLTMNSFTSVSLDPPLILVCVGHSSTSHDRMVTGQGFSVSILASDQGEVAARFAREPSEGRFNEVDWLEAPSGNPAISGAVAVLDCSVHAVHQGGDHSVLIGRVEHATVSELPALVFHRGAFSASGE